MVALYLVHGHLSIAVYHRIISAQLVFSNHNYPNHPLLGVYNRDMYPSIVFITACLFFSSSQTTPISTTFLLLDRIEAILFIHMSKRRIYTQYFSIFVIALQFCANSVILYYRTINYPDQTNSKLSNF